MLECCVDGTDLCRGVVNSDGDEYEKCDDRSASIGVAFTSDAPPPTLPFGDETFCVTAMEARRATSCARRNALDMLLVVESSRWLKRLFTSCNTRMPQAVQLQS